MSYHSNEVCQDCRVEHPNLTIYKQLIDNYQLVIAAFSDSGKSCD
jgi:hypothetical protein